MKKFYTQISSHYFDQDNKPHIIEINFAVNVDMQIANSELQKELDRRGHKVKTLIWTLYNPASYEKLK